MLQQTRVAAVNPYFARFLKRFPTVRALARAAEEDVLAHWAGLGYYSRARNLRRAARQIVDLGGFPRDYATLRSLAGVGEYTAAAVASIAFGLPHAVVDGNVRRVVMRLANSASVDVQAEAERLLDRKNPGGWNQALMELGALVCVPRAPRCGVCPVSGHCGAFRYGTTGELPPQLRKLVPQRKKRTLFVIRKRGFLLLTPSSRVRGFWDLPETETLRSASYSHGQQVGSFRHAITNSQYLFEVVEAAVRAAPGHCRWWKESELQEIPLSTASKKALQCWKKKTGEHLPVGVKPYKRG